jgi:hypothetical protein
VQLNSIYEFSPYLKQNTALRLYKKKKKKWLMLLKKIIAVHSENNKKRINAICKVNWLLKQAVQTGTALL